MAVGIKIAAEHDVEPGHLEIPAVIQRERLGRRGGVKRLDGKEHSGSQQPARGENRVRQDTPRLFPGDSPANGKAVHFLPETGLIASPLQSRQVTGAGSTSAAAPNLRGNGANHAPSNEGMAANMTTMKYVL